MPPEVRRQYEQALRLVQDVAKGAAPPGTMARTVETTRDGVSGKVHTKQLKDTVDGKSYDDPTQLPPEVRARGEQDLHGVGEQEVYAPGPRRTSSPIPSASKRCSRGPGSTRCSAAPSPPKSSWSSSSSSRGSWARSTSTRTSPSSSRPRRRSPRASAPRGPAMSTSSACTAP